MTLSRQLLYGITAVFVLLLLGIEAIYVRDARRSLEQQLDAHANETATSLSLAMGSRMNQLDPVLVNTIVNPVFDRGHFELIEVRDDLGSVTFTRRLERQEIALPGWFVDLVSFDAPSGQAIITSGWLELGRVSVRVHPQFAYRQLWDTALSTLLWLAVLFAGALAAVRVYLAGILRPLGMIEDAAVAIGNRDFVSIAQEPRTRELQRVTRAINSLSAKVRDAIQQETSRAERLRRDAFEDAATGQLNRRGFENAVAAALAEGAEVHSGALALFALGGLAELNREAGLSKGDQVLRQLCDAVLEPGGPDRSAVGRWHGSAFAAFLPNATLEASLGRAGDVCRRFASAVAAGRLPVDITVHAGIGHFASGTTTLAELGVLAEAALAEASSSAGPAAARSREAQAPAVDLRAEIESAIAGGRLSLVSQKVASATDGDILQVELFSRLADARGAAIPAADFVPTASRHGLLPALDTRVAELAMAALRTAKDLPHSVSINVAAQSVLDDAFRERLRQMLKAHPREARRLVFEMTGAAAGKSPDLARDFMRELRRAGSRLALDNFEMDRSAIALASDLMPAYVKLAPVFTREVRERDDARFLLEAMLRVFHPLEIPVIAQGVEDPALVPLLAEIGVSGYQGFVLGRPEPIAD